MVVLVDALELRIRDMGVYLCCGNRCVTKKRLYATDISPVTKEIRGKTVTERVWMDILCDTSSLSAVFNDALYGAHSNG